MPLAQALKRHLVRPAFLVAACLLLTPAFLPAQTATPGGNWTQQFPATSPSLGAGATIAYDASNRNAVIFGGANNSTWTWNGSTWTQQSPSTSPPVRAYAMMAYDPGAGNVVLFGGTSASDPSVGYSDTWTWDGANWTQASPANSPPGRGRGAMVYDAATGKIVLFGGTGPVSRYSDTWTWDGANWTQQSPSTVPPGRYSPAMAYDPSARNVVMFGGGGASSLLSDTWTWDGTNWTQRSPSSSPPATHDPQIAYDVAAGTVILFGGYANNETWEWNGTTWAQQSTSTQLSTTVNGYMTYDTASSSLVYFDGNNATWTYSGGSFVAPSTAVGSTAATQTPVYFTITGSGTLPALSNANILTQGTPGLDFTLGSGSTCTGAVTAGSSCTVNVAFTPTTPGTRLGVVNLLDSSSNILATSYISGTGTGPQAALSPGVLTTYAGSATQCGFNPCPGDGGPATSAQLMLPGGVAVDALGNLYISDQYDNRIRKVSAATGIITALAGSGNYCADPTTACGDGSAATNASVSFDNPIGMAMDGAGNLYIADEYDSRIRKISAATGIISTVAGNGTACSSPSATCGDGGAATSANLTYPYAVAVDTIGNLYIADTSDSRIRLVNAATGIISTLPGVNVPTPSSLAIDTAGNLYIGSLASPSVYKVSAATGLMSTFAGGHAHCAPSTALCGDGGAATSANLSEPYGVAVDAAGNVYISDLSGNRIRKVSAATGIISTVAGTGTVCTGFTCGDGSPSTATAAQFSYPGAIAVDSKGNLYIADSIGETNSADERIRKVSTTAAITFPTVTTAGTPDTTDGTRTVTLNNIGNASLSTSMSNVAGNTASFILANPSSGGCSTLLTAGDSCLLGEEFSPAAGTPATVVGSLSLTSNSLNATAAVQYVPLSGQTSAGGLVVTPGNVGVAAGTSSVTLAASIGYAAASVPTGMVTFTVNGSSTGVSAVTCKSKAAHLNCTATYDPSSLTAGSYTITAAIASDSNYSAASASSQLVITGSSSGAHVSPGTMAAPVRATLTPSVRSAPVAPMVAAGNAPLAVPAAVVTDSASSSTGDNPQTCDNSAGEDKSTCKAAQSAAQLQ